MTSNADKLRREAGVESRPKLKLGPQLERLNGARCFGGLKLAVFHAQTWVVVRLLRKNPGLRRDRFPAHASPLDSEKVADTLAKDPGPGTRPAGRRTPIPRLAFSRWLKARAEIEGDMLAIRFAGMPEMAKFLTDWAEAHRGQVVEQGIV